MKKLIASAAVALVLTFGAAAPAFATTPEEDASSPATSPAIEAASPESIESTPGTPTDGPDALTTGGIESESPETPLSTEPSTVPEPSPSVEPSPELPSSLTEPSESEQPSSPSEPDTGVGEPSHIIKQSWFMPNSTTAVISWPQRLIKPGDEGFCQTDDEYEVGPAANLAIYEALIAGGVLNRPGSATSTDSAIYVGGGYAAPCSMPLPPVVTPPVVTPPVVTPPVVTPPAPPVITPEQPIVVVPVAQVTTPAPKTEVLASTGLSDGTIDAAARNGILAALLMVFGVAGIVVPTAIRQRKQQRTE